MKEDTKNENVVWVVSTLDGTLAGYEWYQFPKIIGVFRDECVARDCWSIDKDRRYINFVDIE